ncbi:hypothetical protein PXY50_22405, partial [Acinetobacter baumannii]|nr:hypothetical protein [Acinetobacter baumannii]
MNSRSHPSSPCRLGALPVTAGKGLEYLVFQFFWRYDKDIDFKKLAPWNWFKNEQQEQQTVSSLPVQRNDLPAASGPV